MSCLIHDGASCSSDILLNLEFLWTEGVRENHLFSAYSRGPADRLIYSLTTAPVLPSHLATSMQFLVETRCGRLHRVMIKFYSEGLPLMGGCCTATHLVNHSSSRTACRVPVQLMAAAAYSQQEL